MRKVLLAVLFSVFLLSMSVAPVLSKSGVGVHVYDFFTYSFSVEQTTTSDGFRVVPIPLQVYLVWNETDSVTKTVTGVSGSNVTFEVQTVYRNDSLVTHIEVENVSNPSMFYPVIAANLNVNDSIKPGGFYVDAILLKPYSYVSREACLMNYTLVYPFPVTFEYLWDRATGILVSARVTTTVTQGEESATTTFSSHLLSTNVIPEFPVGSVMLFVFVFVSVFVTVFGWRRLKWSVR